MIRTLELTDRMYFETIVAGLEKAWNAADGAAFAAYFTDDADFINIYGMHGKGRQAIADAHNLIFRTVYAGSNMQIRITQARLLAEDIALVHFTSLLHVPGGPLAGEKKAAPSAVLKWNGLDWKVAAFHNTLVQPPPPIEFAKN